MRFGLINSRTLLAFAILMLSVTVPPTRAEDNGIIRIGGSTTLLPIISTCAKDFMERYPTWDKLDSSLPKSKVIIFVTGGGSGFGVKALLDNVVQIGLLARELKDQEKTMLGNYTTFLAGKDAIAIVANKNSPLQNKLNFSSNELQDVLSGKIRTFQQLDPSAAPREILLLVRDAGGGSAEIIQEAIMGDKQIASHALQVPSQGALLQKLQAKPDALGYVSAGLVGQDNELIAFSLDGILPSNDNVISNKYKLVRPLYLVVRGNPNRFVRGFIEYVLGEGKNTFRELGYISIDKVR